MNEDMAILLRCRMQDLPDPALVDDRCTDRGSTITPIAMCCRIRSNAMSCHDE